MGQASRPDVKRGAHRFHAILLTNRATSDVLACMERSLYSYRALYVTACFPGLAIDALVGKPRSPLPQAAAAAWNTGRTVRKVRATYRACANYYLDCRERPQPFCRVASDNLGNWYPPTVLRNISIHMDHMLTQATEP